MCVLSIHLVWTPLYSPSGKSRRSNRGHTAGNTKFFFVINSALSRCGACLLHVFYLSREKGSALPFPRRCRNSIPFSGDIFTSGRQTALQGMGSVRSSLCRARGRNLHDTRYLSTYVTCYYGGARQTALWKGMCTHQFYKKEVRFNTTAR